MTAATSSTTRSQFGNPRRTAPATAVALRVSNRRVRGVIRARRAIRNLSRDPGEQAHRAAEEPERTTDLAHRLEGWKSAEAPTAARELDPDAAARLRSLGYTASSAPTRKGQHTEADDPKRLVDVDRRFQTALHLVGDGRHADAAALLREAINRRPDFTAACLALASVYLESGQAPEAVNLLRAAARRGLSDFKLQEQLGAALLASGEPTRAASVLEPLSGDGEQPWAAGARCPAHAASSPGVRTCR